MKCLMFAAVLFAGLSVQARTVAWWHLDELEDGAIAKGGEPLFLNSIDPSKHAGLPRAAPKVKGEWQLDSEYEPVGTVAFPDGGVYRDYVRGSSYANPRGVRLNPLEKGARGTGSLILIPNDAELSLADFTVEFFFKLGDLSNTVAYQHIMCNRSATAVTGEGQDNGGFRFYWDHANDKLGLSLYERWWEDSSAKEKTTTIQTPTGLDIENGRWHHAALTFDSKTKVAKLYVDYRLIGSATLNRGTLGVATNDLILGHGGSDWGCFNGSMDEFRISDCVLGPAEFLRVTDAEDAPQMFPETAVYQRFCGYPDFFGPRTSVFDNLLLLNEAPQGASFGEPASVKKFGAGYALTDAVPVGNVATGYVGSVSSANDTAIALRSTEESRAADPTNPRACPCWNFADPGSSLAQCSFTAETFIRLTNVVKNTYIFFQKNSWSLSINSGTLQLNSTEVLSTSTLTDGIWHHVALVVDGTTHTGSVYVDYQLRKEAVAMLDKTPKEEYLGIGCYSGCVVTFYDVDFDDVRVTKRKLSVDEFLHPKAEGVICDCPFDGFGMTTLGLTTAGTITQTGWQGLRRTEADKPTETIADGMFAEQKPNVSAVSVSGGSANLGSGYYAFTGDDIKALTANSFTFEFQAKFPECDYTNYTGNAGYIAFQDAADGSQPVWCLAFETAEAGANAGKLGFKRGYTAFAVVDGDDLFDGEWHHLAFVYDKDSSELRAYFDYALVGTGTGVELPAESASSLAFGGTGKSGWGVLTLGAHTWAFDNLRIAAKALKPSEFKTSRHISDGETLVWAPFDRTADLIACEGLSAKFTGSAAFSGRKAGVIADAEGAALERRGANLGSLSLASGGGRYSRLSLLEIPDFTAEFFVRGASSAAQGTDLVSLKDKAGTNPVWSVRKGDDGNLHLLVTKEGDMVATDLGSFGAAVPGWTHVALVFRPQPAGTTEVLCYVDHQLAAAKSFEGVLAVGQLQGSSLGCDAFGGFVDEIRITKGALSVSDMLYAIRLGMTLILR